jgi:hypothetical protein
MTIPFEAEDPMSQGMEAFFERKSLEDNPYDDTAPANQWIEWRLGFLDKAYELDRAAYKKHGKLFHEI